jgi:ketosteroid isomerase-like protein
VTADTDLPARVGGFYAMFNARDIEGCLAEMAPDVDWHNAMDDRREIGRAAVGAYWARQFRLIHSTVTPLEVRIEGGEATAEAAAEAADVGGGVGGDVGVVVVVVVTVDQVVRDLSGALLSHATVLHRYRFRDGLVARMDALPLRTDPLDAQGGGLSAP